MKKLKNFGVRCLTTGLVAATLLAGVVAFVGCQEDTEQDDNLTQGQGDTGMKTPEILPYLVWNGDRLSCPARGFGIGPQAMDIQGNGVLIDFASNAFGSEIAEYLFIPMFLDRFPLALSHRDFTEREGFAQNSVEFLERRNGN